MVRDTLRGVRGTPSITRREWEAKESGPEIRDRARLDTGPKPRTAQSLKPT